MINETARKGSLENGLRTSRNIPEMDRMRMRQSRWNLVGGLEERRSE
jgi:hypothetical protein